MGFIFYILFFFSFFLKNFWTEYVVTQVTHIDLALLPYVFRPGDFVGDFG